MNKTYMVNLEYLACLCATIAHKAINQKRKFSGEDYIRHPEQVVKILKDFGIFNEDIIAAAWLHDVVEDTGITLEFIEETFGSEVASIVEQVTDVSKPEDGNREFRKQMDREHYKTSNYRGQTVKLADIIANGHDMDDENFAIVYFKEIAKLLPYLDKGLPELYFEALNMIQDFENSRLQEALK